MMILPWIFLLNLTSQNLVKISGELGSNLKNVCGDRVASVHHRLNGIFFLPFLLFAWGADLKGIITLIEKGVTKKEMRLMAHAIRQMLAVQHRLKASTVSSFLKHALPTSSEALSRLLSFVAKVWMATQCA